MIQTTPLAAYYPPARLVEFANWQLPVFYEGVLKEHQAVRQAVGLFDIAHMGKFRLQAPIAEVERLVPSRLAHLKAGQAQYTLLLNEEGGILDDVIFYYRGADSWRVIVNAATRAADFTWLHSHLESGLLVDESATKTLLALQGPQAASTLQELCDQDLSTIQRFGHAEVRLQNAPAWVARTGYTGEDGFEILTPVAQGIALWQALLHLGVTPCGLGARDSLRLEAAMHLYGQDMDITTNPWAAGLGWVIDLEKGDFLGRTALVALKEVGISQKLVGLEMQERGIARHGYAILTQGDIVGTITSGGPAPSLNRNIAMGYVPTVLAKVGTELQVRIRNQDLTAVVVKRPFYRRGT